MVKCRECENRENIFDEELWDIVGWKCSLTESIISAEVEDNVNECEGDCPLKKSKKVN